MASAKSTFTMLGLILLLAGLGVGGAYVAQIWKARNLEKDLAAAEQALAEGRAADAEQTLTAVLDKAKPGQSWVAKALALRFRALEKIGDPAMARELAARVLDPEKPWAPAGSEAWVRAHLIQADAALSTNNIPQAQPHLEAVLAQPANGNETLIALQDEATIGLARIELALGKVAEGREKLQALVDRLPTDSQARPYAEQVLGQVNVRLLMSKQPVGNDQIHVLEKGDSIDKIARKYKISADLLMGINKISDPRRLRIGMRIKIPDVDFSIIVNKSDNTLTLNNYGKFFKKYKVRTGMEDYMTPVGEFTITNKAKDPAWFNSKTNQKVPPGDPANELGSRWMGFQGTTLGLHEAIDPKTIGYYSSNGCVGMVKQDIEEIFDMVPVGTPLKITGQLNPEILAASSKQTLPATAMQPNPLAEAATTSPAGSPAPTTPAAGGAAPAVALP